MHYFLFNQHLTNYKTTHYTVLKVLTSFSENTTSTPYADIS